MPSLKNLMQKVSLFAKTTGTDNASLPPAISNNLPILCDSNGVVFVKPVTGTAAAPTSLNSTLINTDIEEGPGDTESLLVSGARMDLIDSAGSTTQYSRHRGNSDILVLASAARTGISFATEFTNYNHRGMHVVISVGALISAPSIIVSIQSVVPAVGGKYDLLVGPSISTVGTTILKIYPGIIPVANLSANDMLPRTFTFEITHANANSITYGISAYLTL